MNIAFAFMTCGLDIFGGIDNSIYQLGLGFQELGAQVLIYSSRVRSAENMIGPLSVFRSALLPTELPEGRQQQTIVQCLRERGPAIREEFFHLVRREQLDAVITCDPVWGILQEAGVCEGVPCPIVLSLHVMNAPEVLRRAASIPYLFRQVVSPFLKAQLEQVCPPLDLVVIPNAIDLTRFRPQENLGRRSKVIFCNARVSKDKGTLHLIRAFAAFVQSYPGYELWLCNGSYPFGNRSAALQEVLHEIAELGITASVRFLPHLAWAEIPLLIRQSWVVVLPTLSETFGRAALETLACGVPLVVSRIDNIPTLVQGGALLTEPRSPQSIYEALVRLVKDEALYELLATQGPSIAAPYDRPLVAQQFLQLLQTRMEDQG